MTISKSHWGWSLLTVVSLLSACGGREYDRALANALRTPIDPPSAELSVRFCLDRARSLYRQAQVDRALGNTGLMVGGLTVAVAGSLWLQEDHSSESESKQSTTERATEVGMAVGLTSLVIGTVAHCAAAGKRHEAEIRVEAAGKLMQLADRLDQLETDLASCQGDLEDNDKCNDETSRNLRTDVNADCEEFGVKRNQKDPCFVFEVERCRVRKELTAALGPCVGRGRPSDEPSSLDETTDSTSSAEASSENSASDTNSPPSYVGNSSRATETKGAPASLSETVTTPSRNP